MKCIECEENEAVGGFYCAECTKAPAPGMAPAVEALITARYGAKRWCAQCKDQFRDLVAWQRLCVGCRRKG